MPNLPISGLPVASALTGAEILALVQGGVTSRTTSSAVLTYISNNIAANNGLTNSSGTLKLGGLLTANTTITGGGSYSLGLGTSGSKLSQLNIYSASGIYGELSGDFDFSTDAGAYITPYMYLTPTNKTWQIGSNLASIQATNGTVNLSGNTLAQLTSSTQIVLNAPIYQFATLTASTVPYINASTQLVSSAVTPTELGYVSGVTSSIQTQINGLIAGLSWKQAVACATTGNITLSGEQTIDGVTTSASRVLVKSQSTATQNGIYVSASGAWTRATDTDAGSELVSATVFVSAGTVNADTQWTCTNDSVTIGATNIAFAQVSGAGTYSAGTGLTLSGNVFSINTGYVGQTSITTLGTIGTGVWNGTVIGANYGGTGVANNASSTITISGAYGTTFTVSNTTSVTLPTSGTLYGTATGSITSAQLLNSLTDPTGTGVAVFNVNPSFTGVRIGTSSLGASTIRNSQDLTGATSVYTSYYDGQVKSDVTTIAVYYQTSASTQATSFTLTELQHFAATQGTFGAGSTVTNQFGFVANNLTGASTLNGGFRSRMSAAATSWNLYIDGTAQNYIRGNVGIGSGSSAPSTQLHVLSTTEQLRLGYDSSNYLSTTINSTGSATFALTGTSPTFTFSQATTFSSAVTLSSTINKVTITQPSSSATLTIANGKTLTLNNSITFAGTDSTTMTFPTTSSTIPAIGNCVFHVQLGSISFNPADATTYYDGMYIVSNSGHLQGTGKVYVRKDCTLIGYTLTAYTNGTLGTTETSTVYVRVNNTTDITLDASLVTNAIIYQSNSGALNTNLSAGDYIELKLLTATWTTNPTTFSYNVNLVFALR